jgi:hypothetical protein
VSRRFEFGSDVTSVTRTLHEDVCKFTIISA